jgi:hypothetical protein
MMFDYVLAHSLKVTRGPKLRVDSSVVETHIHEMTERSQAEARAVCDVRRDRAEGAAQRLVQQVETFLPRIEWERITGAEKTRQARVHPSHAGTARIGDYLLFPD